MDGQTQQHHQVITDTNKSALVEVIIWLLLAVSAVAVSVRIVTKVSFVRKFELDDIFILAATILSIAQSITIHVSAIDGLGQQAESLKGSQLRSVWKSQYAANLLTIGLLCLVKLAVLAFIKSLTASRIHHQLVLGLEVFVLLWAISGIFSEAFLCALPTPWNYLDDTCFDRQLIFWKYFGATNIATDALQIGLVIWMIATIQTGLKRRITLVGVFGIRVLVIAMTIAQVVILGNASTTTDPTFDLWPWVAATQAVNCLSIVTACIPYLKPFLKSLESGLLRADELHGLGTLKEGQSSSKLSSKLSTRAKDAISAVRAKNGAPEKILEMSSLSPIKHDYRANAVVGERVQNWDEQSQSSQSRIITETRSWTINVEQSEEK